MASNIRDIISGAAQRYGIEPDVLSYIAQRESNFNPQAKNPNSSAKGLFQFIDSTAKGYGLTDPFDPTASSDAAARLTRDNIAYLEKNLGRKPTKDEIYLSHQQGRKGALDLIMNPERKASDVVGAAAINLNKGRPDMTAAEFVAQWSSPSSRSAPREMPVSEKQGYEAAQPIAPNTQGQPATNANNKVASEGNVVQKTASILDSISKPLSDQGAETVESTVNVDTSQQKPLSLRVFQPSGKRENPLSNYLKSLFT